MLTGTAPNGTALSVWSFAVPSNPLPRASLPAPTRADIRAREFDLQALPHMDDLYRMALRLTRDAGRAQDAVQETYLQAWKSFDRFQPGTNCRAWLYKILFHCVHHQRRKWLRFPSAGKSEEILDTLPGNPLPAPEHLTDAQILSALDAISNDYRAVVLLVDVEEFPYREAAEILAIPVGTVMSRLSRARTALRARLEGSARQHGILKSTHREPKA